MPAGRFARYWHGFAFTDPSGTKHEFPVAFYEHPTTGCPDWGSEPRTGHATNGSGYFLDATNPTAPFVLTPSGHRIDVGQKLTDPNGNFIQRVTTSPNHFEWKDTRGKAALKIDVTPGSFVDFRVLDTNGTYQTTRVHYQSFQIVTDFDCPGIQEYSGTALLPTRIDLPNGQFWSFAYENTPGNLFGNPKTGRLASVTLPTGGILGYAYNSPNMGVSCEDGAAASMTRLDAVGNWTFDRVRIGGTWKTFVGAPALSYDNYRSEHTFSDGRQTKEQVFSGETLLRIVDTTWTTGSPPTPKARVVTLDDGKKSKVETDFDPQFGTLLAVREYAFESGGQYALVRRTENTYLAEPEYVARNIRNRLSSQIVKDGANQVVSRTDIVYDDYQQEPLVCVTGAPQHDDTNYGCSFETRGNPTHVKRYLDPATATNPIVRAVQYDSLGNARTAELDCCQERQFQFSAATGWAFPDSVVSGPPGGPQLTVSSTYNTHTGQLATSTDANGQVTSFLYDLWKRPTKVTRPGGTEFTTAYDDVARTVTTTAPLTAATSRKSKTYFDAYGRPFKTELRDGADTLIAFTESQFDSMGRAWRTSNPRGSPSDPAYWTESRWDALGRPTVVIPPDGTATSNSTRYSYLGNQVTVTDPAGNQKKTVSDALGRMVELWEPNPASSSELLLTTQYAWTTLGNLSTVTQGSQTRSYTWDALGRMLSETTPEAGLVSNTVIDSFGNVREQVDARGVKTIFSFDGLNRLTGISWDVSQASGVPATAPVSYVYGTDADGTPNDTSRLKTITDGLGSETLTYDILGRVTDRQRVIDGQSFAFHYAHNLADEVTSVTYPSGRVVTYGQDPVGRLTSVTTGGTNLLSNLAWSPAGLPTGWTYGNGVTASFGWTPERLLLSEIRYDRPQPGGTMIDLTYEYGNAAGNDGRVKKINDLVVPDRTVNFEYDGLSRLKRAYTVGGQSYPAWELTWDYTASGNRTAQNAVVGNPPSSSLAFDPATNRVTSTGWTHDATGNVTATPDGTFSIDAGGRTIGHTPVSGPALGFVFDATGLRTKRTEGSSTTLYLRDGGQVIGEWNGASWSKEYVWLGSTLLATIEGSTIKYHHADHLSIRATTFADGMTGEEQGHYPFGEPWYETSPETTRIFTTYEREAGGSLDYAMFRWMGPEAARFLSADPVHGSMGDGQSWNRYAYSTNDPVNLADPFGLRPSPFQRSHDPGFGPGSGGPGGGGGFGYLPWDADLEAALHPGGLRRFDLFPGLDAKLRIHLYESGNRFITPTESEWATMYPDSPYPWKAYENESTPRMRECLAQVFGVTAADIAVVQINTNTVLPVAGKLLGYTYMISGPGSVDVPGTEAQFWASPRDVLHELFHVFGHWATGDINLVAYVGAFLSRGANNRWDREADAFAKDPDVRQQYETCLGAKEE